MNIEGGGRPAKPLVPKLRFPKFRDAGTWATKTIQALATVVRGGSPRPIEDYLTPGSDGLNWLKIGDVDKSAKFVTRTSERVRLAALAKTRVVHPDDLILSNSMSFGRPYILKIETCIHDGWLAISELRQGVETEFLYYLLLTPSLQSYFRDSAAGSGVLNLNAEIIKNAAVTLPSNLEQQKIADCLSSLDDVIAAEDERLAALRGHKQGLMQALFPAPGQTTPRLRFPEFDGAGAWGERAFGSLFLIGGGRDYQHLSAGNIPVYGSGGYMLSVDEHLYDGESACIGRKGTIDRPLFLTGKFWTVDTLFYTHSFTDCIPYFVYLLFQNVKWKPHSEAGGIPSLSKTVIERIRTSVPSVDEQLRISDLFKSLEAVTASRLESLEALKIHRIALMQQLFPAPEPSA